MTPFLSQILPVLAACKAPTDYYRAQIEIQKHATPADVAALKDRPVAWSDEFDRWLGGLFSGMTFASREISDYRLEVLSGPVSLYSGPARPAGLIVAFCGRADLLFMPIALVLQYFSPERCSVLVLRDPAKVGFSDGMKGHSASFREMIANLQAGFGFDRYSEIRTFGASGGAAAALAAGMLLGARSAVSFSGHLPSASVDYGAHPAAIELERILRGAGGSGGELACVHGADNRRDASRALDLATVIGARLYSVPGVSDHNVVYELHKRRQLASLLTAVGLT